MAGEKQHKKKAAVVDGTTTPKKKNQKAKRAVIGSSSTWKEEQLELYNVKQQDAMSAKELIPEKWFDFMELKNEYQAGITSCVLTDGSVGDTFVNPIL